MNDTSFLNKLKEKSLEWKPHKDTPEALQKLQVRTYFNAISNLYNIYVITLLAGNMLGHESSKSTNVFEHRQRRRGRAKVNVRVYNNISRDAC